MRPNSAKNIFKGKDVLANPKVSIIIPAYNIAGFIAETLESVFLQTFTDFEVILINDGSPDTDAFEKVIEPYKENLVYLKIENIGAGAARNFGIEEAKGELIAFLDGDDIWYPEYLQNQIEFLEKNNFDMVYSDALLFGGSASDGRNYMLDAPSEGVANFESILDLRCNVITSGTIVRKEKVVGVGMFEWEKVRAHDFILWLKIARIGSKIGYQKKVLLKYRVRIDSLTGDSFQKIQREIDVFKRIPQFIELNHSEINITQKHLERLEAALEVEHGKSYLLQKKFSSARKSFEKGNKYQHSMKLNLIIWALRIAPNLFLKFYQSKRSEEIAFIPVSDK